MKPQRPLTICAALAIVAALGGTAYADDDSEALEATGATAESVSAGPSLFANCTIGGSTGAVVSTGSEAEPWVAVNPRHPRRTIASYQQDRWSAAGGSHGLGTSYSHDGKHFTKGVLPFDSCAGGADHGLKYERASDVWVSYGPDGVAYSSGLVFNVSDPSTGVVAATSSDDGKTWENIQPLIQDTQAEFGNDKNSVTADPNHEGYAYQVWDRLDQTATTLNGPAFISITTDHGKTWSKPAVFVDTGVTPNTQTIGNIIVADANNDVLYDFFDWITYTDATGSRTSDVHFAFVKSTDQGQTWSKPTAIAPDTSVPEVDPNAPTDTTKALRAGANLISAAIDPTSGKLYATYEGSDFSDGKYDQIELVSSSDGGATWTKPILMSQVPTAPAFTPSIVVDEDGNVALTYKDLRNLKPGDTTTVPTAEFMLTFGCGDEATPGERQISPVFDWLKAPYATWGHFLGDYEGLAVVGHGKFRPLFAVTSNDPADPSDVFSGVFGMNPKGSPKERAAEPKSGPSGQYVHGRRGRV
ncbi:exo-alpha-sialidase [Nocardia arthritidis]|uniref:exo-alpha-sialidase n=1 Tax=Nocardia arthritidis TaxID=228602 RepID=A0A6G9YI10_9NOCA|nr:sialidase family protein [Nocardia arthritidis]QIS12800.1 neuraminidase (sialidase) [Nocardia arthritidis]